MPKQIKQISHIKTFLKLLNVEDKVIGFVLREIEMRDLWISEMQSEIEIKNKIPIEKDKRFIEVFDVDSNVSKITINPVTGRITLKISDRIKSERIRSDYLKLAEKVKLANFPAATHRGRIKYLKESNSYSVYLENLSQTHNKTITVNA
jgi:hypothetical protein